MNTKLILIFTATMIATILNPFDLKIGGLFLYSLPIASYWFISVRDQFGLPNNQMSKKELEPISDARKELIRSVLRHVVTVLGAILAIGVKVPYLSDVFAFVSTLFGSYDAAIEAVQVLIGVLISLISVFDDKARFQSRSLNLIEPRKLD